MPPRVDFKSQRLFVDADLDAGTTIELTSDHAHYLLTVLRMESGAELLVFNGRDGEWRARVMRHSKRAGELTVLHQTREQPPKNDLWLVFAPIKRGRIEFLVEKAVEMGVSHLQPILTEHTQQTKARTQKLQATIVEAAEQCGVLHVPSIEDATPLAEALTGLRDTERVVLFCDEQAELADPSVALNGLGGRPLALIIGPEGGFSDAERSMLTGQPHSRTLALGPRILRAETAAIAGLTLVQLLAGDWRD